jgi:hypothetical protein
LGLLFVWCIVFSLVVPTSLAGICGFATLLIVWIEVNFVLSYDPRPAG